MGNLIMKFCSGETDLNGNGLNDRDEILKVVDQYIMKKELNENEQKGKKVLTLLDGIPAEPEFALGALAGPLPGPAGLPEATPRVPGVAEVVCRVLQRSKPTLVTKHARWSHGGSRTRHGREVLKTHG